MKYLISCILLISLLSCGYDNPTTEVNSKTYNTYLILNETNSELIAKVETFNHIEADSVVNLLPPHRIKLFDYWGIGALPVTPREAIKRIAIFKDSAGVLNQVYLQDPINNSLWQRIVIDSIFYDYTLVIDENDIQ